MKLKLGMFNSIYFLTFLASFVIFLALVLWLSLERTAVFTEERKIYEQQVALAVLNETYAKSAMEPQLMMKEMKRVLEAAKLREKGFTFLNSGIYSFVETSAGGQEYGFKLAEGHSRDMMTNPAEALAITKDEYQKSVRHGEMISTFWIPVSSSQFGSQLLVLSLRDADLKGFVEMRRILFWVLAAGIFFLFYGALAGSIYLSVKRPVHRLQSTLETADESVDDLTPEDFGEFGGLVDALKTYVANVRSSVAAAVNTDPVTGFTSGNAAAAAYQEVLTREAEMFAVFFRANFAKEYVKTFGRAFRDKILKMTASAVAAGAPRGSKFYSVQDHFLMTFLTEPAFHACYPSIQKYFGRSVAPLYQQGQGQKVSMMTLSAAGISNQSKGYESELQDVLQKIHEEWDTTVNRPQGGWAMMNSDDQWVKGTAGDMGEAEMAEEIPEEPESLKDPQFARKAFIVKLAFMFKFDPKKAAKLYNMGFTRIPALLEDGVLDTVKKYGGTAEEDIRQLIDTMRLVPKQRLYYNETDFRQVFVTDVRMVRKIPREVVAHWFAAGLRSVEDLADMDTGDLLKIDGAAAREDVQAVVDHARSLRAAAGTGKKA